MAFKKLKLWFDEDLAISLSKKIVIVYTDFNSDKFCHYVNSKITALELKDRIEVFADGFHLFLPKEYTSSLAILLSILGEENKEEIGMFLNYYWIMPIAKYVEKYGLDDFDSSMNAIKEITKRNTGEYAIRPFLRKHPKQTLAQMLVWSQHKNKHVRRLASEGIRPRLPWETKLQEFIDSPKLIFPILENLKDDSSKYVQKSVANCVNDILKDNFAVGQQLIEKWSQNPTKQRKWIVKHAIRNYRKKEDIWALKIMKKLDY